MLIKLAFLAAAFVLGFLVGRNNPNIAVVNDLIAKGKAVVDTTGKLIKKL